ncbi:MAG TPA: hypothetical protein VM940_09895 [Chthoniobacterales bacterium]|nr:hypothetical protein [Chthoniobacterales bacterium]
MRFFLTLLAFTGIAGAGLAQNEERKFAENLAATVQAMEKKNATAVAGSDGWLFFGGDLRLLSLGRFWGQDAAKVSRAQKPELADPLPAIIDFHQQLKARGVELLVVPVPPKAAIYADKLSGGLEVQKNDPAPGLRQFYEELGRAGIDFLDLSALFIQNRDNTRGPVYCKTDSHWSGVGCALAAQGIAEKIRGKLQAPTRKEYAAEWKETEITGDLVTLLSADAPTVGKEKIAIQRVTEKDSGAPVAVDANSPLLILGDSHTLVYRDFLGERAGLLDQLAFQLGFAPDLIGTRGSGATPVRINLYRRSLKEAGYLAKKKVIIWCFAAREFTETTEGWAKVPVAK